MKREFKSVQSEVRCRMNAFLNKKDCLELSMPSSLGKSLSRKEAVAIALQNNPDLQAALEDIGIAKADLMNAGLYTNPRIDSVFKLPGPNASQTNLEVSGVLKLSDLWLVPLSQRVSQDVLEIVSLRVLELILDIIRDVKIAYNRCVAAELLLDYATKMTGILKSIQDMHAYYMSYGYGNSFIYLDSQVNTAIMQAEIPQLEFERKSAFMHLQKLLGKVPTGEIIHLLDSLCFSYDIPELKQLQDYAVEYRPEMAIARMKIKQFKDQAALERGRIFDDVDVGVTYEKDFEGEKGLGPSFAFSIPIFNQNNANIARAQFLQAKAEKELVAQQLVVMEQVRQYYFEIEALKKSIDIYKNNIFSLREKMDEWTKKYIKRMRIQDFVPLRLYLDTYQNYKDYIFMQERIQNSYAYLERSVSRKIHLRNA